MERTRALARRRMPARLAGRATTRFALLGLGLLAAAACRDVDRTVGLKPNPVALNLAGDGEETTVPIGAPASYTSGLSASASRSGGLTLSKLAPSFSIAAAADPRPVVRIYKDHDAWRTNPDGGRDEATLLSMGMVKGTDFFVEPMSKLAEGIPAGTRAVIISPNSLGDPATSEAQSGPAAQAALLAFLQAGGTLVVDMADNHQAGGYSAPGAAGTPAFSLPSNCFDASLAPAALGGDGVAGTADDHRFVRGPDGMAATADDMDDVKIDLARGGSNEQTDQNTTTDPEELRETVERCAVVHGNLEEGITLPNKARVLATATWAGGQKPVLAEYCHMGGRVILNTFTNGYYDHKPREGASTPIRMSFIQKNLYSYAVSAETYCNKPPTIAAPAGIDVATDAGVCSAVVGVGLPVVTDDVIETVDIKGERSDGAALDAPYPAGATTITWTATDVELESVSATQVVSVRDMEAPVITVPGNISANTDPGSPTASVNPGVASATDNCDETVTITASRSDGAAAGAPFPVGSTTITWTAQDASGNVSPPAAQTVIVSDAEAPVVKVPANMAVNATMPSGAKVSYKVTALDNVKVMALSCTRKTGTTFPIGLNTVTCTAADGAGNSGSGTFTVKVYSAAEQLVHLMEYIKGAMINSAYRQQLIDFLTRALAEPRGTATTCRLLDLLIAAVKAKSGTTISTSKANRIITDATRIKAVLACPAT